MDIFTQIENIAHDGAFGRNTRPHPTQAQVQAGNYKKGSFWLHGLPIVIETPRGEERKWVAPDGKSGCNLMKFSYGYIRGTKGADGDEVDCFIGSCPELKTVYVINQNIDGAFDEHKLMIGFLNEESAINGYRSCYAPGWAGMGSCVECSMEQLKWWLKNGNLSHPLQPDNLPYEEPVAMKKVLWTADGTPYQNTFDNVLYAIRVHDAGQALLFDPLTISEVVGDSEGVLVLDALVVPLHSLQLRMNVLVKALNRAGSTVTAIGVQVSEPFTQRSVANVVAIFELSDGQTISIFFHNPNTTPKKIGPEDVLISFKWCLNKKDITIVVAPERGKDLDVREVAMRVMKLAALNSERFAKANITRAKKMQDIAEVKTRCEEKKKILQGMLDEITELEMALGDSPVQAYQPDAQQEAAATTPVVPVSLPIANLPAIVAAANPINDMPANWILLNGPVRLVGTDVMSNGPATMLGPYYAAIDPADELAAEYLEQDIGRGAYVVFLTSQSTINAMALHHLNVSHLEIYNSMSDAELTKALQPYVADLNGKTYEELIALAARGAPSLPSAAVHDDPAISAMAEVGGDVPEQVVEPQTAEFVPPTSQNDEGNSVVDQPVPPLETDIASDIPTVQDTPIVVPDAEPGEQSEPPVIEIPVVPESPAPANAEPDPTAAVYRRADDIAMLNSVIDQSVDMYDTELSDRIAAISESYQEDKEVMELFAKAVSTYTNYMAEAIPSAV